MTDRERYETAAEIERTVKPWQYATNEGWVDAATHSASLHTCVVNRRNIRIKPEPTRVPLGPEDVPPGSALRAVHHTRTWGIISGTGDSGIYNSDGNLIKWDTLLEAYEIKRPGQDWHPCHKETT